MAISRASDSSIQDGLPKYNDIWDGTTATSAFDTLSSVTLGTASSTVSISNIPQTYTHLQLRIFCQQSGSQYTRFYFNTDQTVANYRTHYLTGSGTAASSGQFSTFGGIIVSGAVAGMGTGNFWSATIIDILDYTNTNKNKTTKTLFGLDQNGGTSAVELSSGLWASTSAISSINFVNPDQSFSIRSSFSLYGVK